MPYVHRENGDIIKITKWPNGSEEFLPDDDPEVVAFLNKELTIDEIYEQSLQNQKILKAVVITLNKLGVFTNDNTVLSNTDLKELIKNNI